MPGLGIKIVWDDGSGKTFNELGVNAMMLGGEGDKFQPVILADTDIKGVVYDAANIAVAEPFCGTDCEPNSVCVYIKFSNSEPEYLEEMDKIFIYLLQYDAEEMDSSSYSGSIVFFVENKDIKVTEAFSQKIEELLAKKASK